MQSATKGRQYSVAAHNFASSDNNTEISFIYETTNLKLKQTFKTDNFLSRVSYGQKLNHDVCIVIYRWLWL